MISNKIRIMYHLNTVGPNFVFPHFTSQQFMHLYSSGQMPIRAMFPEFHAICKWSPQNCKITVLLYKEYITIYIYIYIYIPQFIFIYLFISYSKSCVMAKIYCSRLTIEYIYIYIYLYLSTRNYV